MQLMTHLEGVAMATVALGHGMASSDDATASQPDKATLRASAALLEPSVRQRRDGKGARTAGHVEQQRRRGQPWRRWKNSDDSPLPRLDWTDGEVEKVEKTTARLLIDWATHFHGGERARRRRRAVGNGGATALLLRSYRRAEEKQMEQASRSAGARGSHVAASSARMRTTCSLREQKADDGWQHAALAF